MAPPEGGADFWIMWRRVAGGLNVQLQNSLFNRLRPVLMPGKGKNCARPGANEFSRDVARRRQPRTARRQNQGAAGADALEACRRSPVPTHAFWALTRLGARVLLYGPLNAVVHPDVVAVLARRAPPFRTRP